MTAKETVAKMSVEELKKAIDTLPVTRYDDPEMTKKLFQDELKKRGVTYPPEKVSTTSNQAPVTPKKKKLFSNADIISLVMIVLAIVGVICIIKGEK